MEKCAGCKKEIGWFANWWDTIHMRGKPYCKDCIGKEIRKAEKEWWKGLSKKEKEAYKQEEKIRQSKEQKELQSDIISEGILKAIGKIVGTIITGVIIGAIIIWILSLIF